MSKSYIKCQKCNTLNLNNDYCSNCETILNVVLDRNIKRELQTEEKFKIASQKKPNKVGEFLKKGEHHSNILIRIFFKTAYAIWMFFAVVVGGIIAAVIGIAAG